MRDATLQVEDPDEADDWLVLGARDGVGSEDEEDPDGVERRAHASPAAADFAAAPSSAVYAPAVRCRAETTQKTRRMAAAEVPAAATTAVFGACGTQHHAAEGAPLRRVAQLRSRPEPTHVRMRATPRSEDSVDPFGSDDEEYCAVAYEARQPRQCGRRPGRQTKRTLRARAQHAVDEERTWTAARYAAQ